MKTAEQIGNEVAIGMGYTDFNNAIEYEDVLEFTTIIAKVYAQSAIDEIKEKIVDEAKVECEDWGKPYSVDKESIRSVTIELK